MLANEKIIIKASFEVIGESRGMLINAAFDVTKKPLMIKKKIEGTQTFGNTGVISKRNGYFQEVVPNAKVVAYKNGIVYDFDTTDENGEYTLFLEDGVYDISINAQSYQKTIKNYKHENGIQPYREVIVEGQIKRQLFDVIEFVEFNPTSGKELIDQGARLVSGVISGEHGQPIEGAEIVVAEADTHKVHAFVKTDKEGKYCFTIERENYDIILRSPRHNAKLLKGHLFIPDKGFIPQVIENSLMFRKGGEWLWISN